MIAFVGIASFASAHVASANYSMNTASNDCSPVNIGNYTTGEGISDPCWTETTTHAAVGDVINVAIYYHNAGDVAAPNVSFKLSDPTSQTISSNGTVTFAAKVLVNGSVVSGGLVTAQISGGPSQLTFGHVANYTQSSNANTTVTNGSDIFTSGGLSIGSVAPGWDAQGVIKVSFNVVGNTTCTNCNNGQVPTVATSPVSNLNSNNGSATLNGYFANATTTWFQYRQNGGAWITNVGSVNQYLPNGTMIYNLSNLSQGNYDYEAVAQNSYGTVYGNPVSFSIGNNSVVCPSGTTGIYPNCVAIVQNYCPSGTTGVYPNCYAVQNYCPAGTTGVYPNCYPVQINCQAGYIPSNGVCVYQGNQITTQLPSITTLGTIGITSTSAAVDGYYNSNGCAVSTYFQYGTSQSFGSTTNAVARNSNSGSMAQALSGLQPNTTYYYRAVGQNCAGTNYGTTNSFTTSGVVVYHGGTTTHTTVIDTIGGGNAFLQLTIDNHETSVTGNTNTPYDITWKNISGSTLKDIVLEVNFPSQMTITNPGIGSIEPKKSSVVYHITSLDPNESGQMTIIGSINGGMKQGDPVVAQAVAAFQNPKGDATENAIAYDADTFAVPSSLAGASLFGLGFLPNSLGGWLIIILIILIIIIVAHYYFVGRHKQLTVVHTQAPIAPAPAPAAQAPDAMVPDYTVYRPNPKQ